ncbi:MAG: RNA polymerase sigma factor [Flavobacteriaceae bacterium]
MKIIPIYSSEKQLIKKAVQGDQRAQQRIYGMLAPKMLGVCRQYISDIHFAEDTMVNAFIKVFKQLHTFRFQGSFEGWVRRIMIRESISYLRKRQFVVYDGDAFELENVGEVYQDFEWNVEYLQKLIDGLPHGYKAVFVMYAIEGYKHAEIAELLNISESTSKSQLFKARKMLKEQLKKQNIIGYGTK